MTIVFLFSVQHLAIVGISAYCEWQDLFDCLIVCFYSCCINYSCYISFFNGKDITLDLGQNIAIWELKTYSFHSTKTSFRKYIQTNEKQMCCENYYLACLEKGITRNSSSQAMRELCWLSAWISVREVKKLYLNWRMKHMLSEAAAKLMSAGKRRCSKVLSLSRIHKVLNCTNPLPKKAFT